MPDIVTLTMNPSVDTYLAGDSFRTSKIRCATIGAGPGGGGVNVARVIRKLGGIAAAMVTVGGPNGRRLLGMLDEREVPHHDIWCEGETRDTYVIFERESRHRYHIIIEGQSPHEREWRAALDLVGVLARPGLYLVLSGSLPPGVPDDFYAQVASIAKEHGCRVAVDTSGPPLAAALAEGVWLAKPNRKELQTLAGHEIPTLEERREVAERLIREGAAEVIAATFGHEGSLVLTAEESWLAQAPPIQLRSEVGAGDSFLGALILAITEGRDLQDANAYAVAAAGSALGKSGPGLSDKGETERLYAEIRAGEGVRRLTS